MDLDLAELTAAVLQLPSTERAELAARLLASLEDDEAARQAYEAAWTAELARRDQEADGYQRDGGAGGDTGGFGGAACGTRVGGGRSLDLSLGLDHRRFRDMSEPVFDYLRLSIAERIQLVGDIWDSIAAEVNLDPSALPLSQEDLTEVRRRLDEHERDPGSALSWEQLRSGLFRRSE